MDVVGEVGEFLEVNALAARASVPAMVGCVHDEPEFPESRSHVVVAPRMFAESVAQDENPGGFAVRCPHVVDDLGAGHSGERRLFVLHCCALSATGSGTRILTCYSPRAQGAGVQGVRSSRKIRHLFVTSGYINLGA